MSSGPKPATWWRDTLFKRLFALMWVALVASHLVAYGLVHLLPPPLGLAGAPAAAGPARPGLPPLPSLPPGNPLAWPDGPGPAGPRPAGAPSDQTGRDVPPPPAPPPGLPRAALWFDYAVRFAVLGLAAALAARWLSRPVRQLSAASADLARELPARRDVPLLDTRHGTVELRQAAEAFNQMAVQLRNQFDAQSLLMASLSHDLRTPLTRLRLRLEALQDSAQADTTAVALAVADVRAMDDLIGSVLQMVRSQHLGSPPQRVDLAALVQSLVDDLADLGEPVEWQPLAADPEANPPMATVNADPLALQRVVGNLVANALKHAGSARVGLEAQASGWWVHVDDDGPGLAAAEREAVFQPFYRVGQSQKDSRSDTGALHGRGGAANTAAGSGLGLYIARDLARRDGGRVQLSPREPRGLRASAWWPSAAGHPDVSTPTHGRKQRAMSSTDHAVS